MCRRIKKDAHQYIEEEILMFLYKIHDAYMRNEHVDIKKVFSSRSEAINYMFSFYNNHYLYNVELEEEYPQSNKHDIHYVINQYNSFNVTRQKI